MQTDVLRTVYPVAKKQCEVRHAFVLGKCKIALSEPDKSACLYPSRQVIPVETRLPCIYLVDVETSKVEQLSSEFKIVHEVIFPLCRKYSALWKQIQ